LSRLIRTEGMDQFPWHCCF